MLAALNGTGQAEDPYTPSKLIQSLISQGWFIPHGEQDAHELFHVIVATLEEEIQQPLSKVQHLFLLIVVWFLRIADFYCVCLALGLFIFCGQKNFMIALLYKYLLGDISPC